MSPRRDPLQMITYEKALAVMEAAVRPLGPETVGLDAAAGRFLARPLRARCALPRFEQSAMDGFAVRAADLAAARAAAPVTLALAGELPAGTGRRIRLRRGTTVKVFTGGRLPGGADTVVMQEHARQEGDGVTFTGPAAEGDHVRRRGEELRRGDEILPAGLRITPPVVGLLATFGDAKVRVGRTPRVAVITLGDELTPPGRPLAAGRIYDANGPALRAALRGVGVDRIRLQRVRDDEDALVRALERALEAADLVLTVGGASVGDHDHVAAARARLGVREHFHRVAIKPGKPNIFGVAPGGVPVFGLPGNPVSALVSFHQLVMPLLRRLMGGAPGTGRAVPVRLGQALERRPGRTLWLRGRLEAHGDGLRADLTAAQGSHMLSGLALADVLAEVAAECSFVAADDVLRAWLIDWNA